jgi:hypothetical protein
VIETWLVKKKDKVPENYKEALMRVQHLFFYQTVYDPRTKKLTSLEKIPNELEVDLEFLGSYIDEKVLPDYVQGLIKKYNF